MAEPVGKPIDNTQEVIARLNDVIRQAQLSSTHNSPISPQAVVELQAIVALLQASN
jgi:hypothetical protein